MTDQPKAQVVQVDTITGLTWIKSSASGAQDSSCVELARTQDHILVRCSHDRSGTQLSLPTVANLIKWVRQES